MTFGPYIASTAAPAWRQPCQCARSNHPHKPSYDCITCPSCHGQGTVSADYGDVERDVRCPRCDGKCSVIVEQINVEAVNG